MPIFYFHSFMGNLNMIAFAWFAGLTLSSPLSHLKKLTRAKKPRKGFSWSSHALFFFFSRHITMNGLKEGARCHSNLKKKLISLENGPNTANKMKIV